MITGLYNDHEGGSLEIWVSDLKSAEGRRWLTLSSDHDDNCEADFDD